MYGGCLEVVEEGRCRGEEREVGAEGRKDRCIFT